MICSVCGIGLHLILKFLSVNLFLWGYELANSFLLFSVHKSFLQIIKKFSLRHTLHFLLILSYGLQVASTFHCTQNTPGKYLKKFPPVHVTLGLISSYDHK